jgi:hypothetical protein
MSCGIADEGHAHLRSFTTDAAAGAGDQSRHRLPHGRVGNHRTRRTSREWTRQSMAGLPRPHGPTAHRRRPTRHERQGDARPAANVGRNRTHHIGPSTTDCAAARSYGRAIGLASARTHHRRRRPGMVIRQRHPCASRPTPGEPERGLCSARIPAIAAWWARRDGTSAPATKVNVAFRY